MGPLRYIATGVLIGSFVFSGWNSDFAQTPKKKAKPVFQIVFDNRHYNFDRKKRESDVDIYVMDIYGQNVRRLTSDHLSYSPSLSPDGKQIAYVHDEEPSKSSDNSWILNGVQEVLTRPRNLFRMDVGGGNAIPITSITPDVQGMSWLPDSEHIALRSSNRRDLKVYISHGKEFDAPFERVNTVEGMTREFRETPSKEWHDPVLVEFYPTTDNFLPALFLHWGMVIAGPKQMRDVESRMTFVPELDASVRLISKAGDTVESTVNAFDATWSPDGKRIAYSSFSDKENSVLSVGDLTDGRADAVRALTAPELEAHGPVWSPDGSRLAFTARWKVSQQLFLINADGSGLVRFNDDIDRFCAHPSWSPDGRWIVAECRDRYVYSESPYADLDTWRSSIYLFDASKPRGTPRLLMNCDYSEWQYICGAHNPSFVPVVAAP
jgi:Tol biopolymer transport system component